MKLYLNTTASLLDKAGLSVAVVYLAGEALAGLATLSSGAVFHLRGQLVLAVVVLSVTRLFIATLKEQRTVARATPLGQPGQLASSLV